METFLVFTTKWVATWGWWLTAERDWRRETTRVKITGDNWWFYVTGWLLDHNTFLITWKQIMKLLRVCLLVEIITFLIWRELLKITTTTQLLLVCCVKHCFYFESTHFDLLKSKEIDLNSQSALTSGQTLCPYIWNSNSRIMEGTTSHWAATVSENNRGAAGLSVYSEILGVRKKL